MLAAYLLLNAALYLIFALATTFAPQRIAAALGLDPSGVAGKVEFFTVYGGLELGLAAFYAWAAFAGGSVPRTALMFSLFLYAGIVLYRGIALGMYGWPGNTVAAVAGLELLMLAGAAGLLLRS